MKETTLVLGASGNVNRYSNRAIRSLERHGKKVAAIGLREIKVGKTAIQTGTPDLENINTVTLYLNPKRQPAYYTYILSLKPQRVIFNPGTENPEFYTLLESADIEVIRGCTLVMLSTNQY